MLYITQTMHKSSLGLRFLPLLAICKQGHNVAWYVTCCVCMGTIRACPRHTYLKLGGYIDDHKCIVTSIDKLGIERRVGRVMDWTRASCIACTGLLA